MKKDTIERKYVRDMSFLVVLLIIIIFALLIGIQSKDTEIGSLQYNVALESRRMDAVNETITTQNRIIDTLIELYANKTCYDFQPVFQNVSQNEWTNNFTCVNFSAELKTKLNNLGYQAEVVHGDVPARCFEGECYTRHAFVEMFVEPETGQFVRISDGYIPDGVVC
jgi:hypothetical protein